MSSRIRRGGSRRSFSLSGDAANVNGLGNGSGGQGDGPAIKSGRLWPIRPTNASRLRRGTTAPLLNAAVDFRRSVASPHDLPPDHPRRPRLRLLPDRRRGRRRRGRGRPALRDRRVPRAGALHGRARSSTCSRRTTTPTTSPATAGWPPPPARRSTSTATPSPTTTTSRSTTAGSSSSARVRVRALHTPGHRPEHTAFALIDTRARRRAVGGADRRHAVRRRHRAARPGGREGRGRARDLPLAARQAADAAATTCEVWPGHLGGSLCGGPGMDMKVSSTIGFERAPQPDCCAIDDEDAFVERALAGARPQPPNFQSDRRAQPRPAADRRRRAACRWRRARSSSSARGRRAAGRRAHRRSSSTTRTSPARSASRRCAPASAPSSRGSPTASSDDRVRRPRRRGRAARRAARAAVGLRRLGGFLHGGMTSWRQEKRADRARSSGSTSTSCTSARDERADPRRPRARRVGRRPHPRLAFTALARHRRRCPTGSTRSGRSRSICASGQRAAIAASLLQRAGAREVIHVVEGGVPKWGRLGNPIEKS